MKIKVISVHDGNFWFTQGIEVDYGAQGNTMDESVTNFKHGLEATIRVRRSRGLTAIPRPPPPELLVDIVANSPGFVAVADPSYYVESEVEVQS
jgi:hypothetical protein